MKVKLFMLPLYLFVLISCRKEYSCKCGNAINTYKDRLTKSQANEYKEKCESQPNCEFIKGNGTK
ncbi:MAG: hypothetical protein NZ529_03880 [Cytophagaceae bacterium]|nr:hypothetical protein [Cytophagaceae bacterium]MDW8455911.1 hypothetical protein [Cytophagaceae bacterium]